MSEGRRQDVFFDSIIILYVNIGVFHICYDAIKYNMCFDIDKTKISKNNACTEDQIYINKSIDIVYKKWLLSWHSMFNIHIAIHICWKKNHLNEPKV